MFVFADLEQANVNWKVIENCSYLQLGKDHILLLSLLFNTFWSSFLFSYLWCTFSFLTFSGDIEMEHWATID